MKFKQFALALMLSTSLVGCGTSGTGITQNLKASSGSAISHAESVQLDSLNSSSQLNELDEETLQALEGTDGDIATASYSTQSFFGTTKIGYVRSIGDGKYFLQTKEGVWKKTPTSLSLSSVDEKVTSKLSKDLNHKVLVRGSLDGTTFNLKSVYAIPDLSLLIDIFRTGSVHGITYLRDESHFGWKEHNSGGVLVTARSLATNQVYRDTSNRMAGYYRIHRLPPGEYLLEATYDGYSVGTASVTVSKIKFKKVKLTVTR